MKRVLISFSLSFLLVNVLPRDLSAQTSADPGLVAEIARIKAIDNDTHVTRVVGPGEEDHEYDALPFELIEAFPTMVRYRPDNLEFVGAWRALFGYKYSDMTEAHVRELAEARQRAM